MWPSDSDTEGPRRHETAFKVKTSAAFSELADACLINCVIFKLAGRLPVLVAP